MKVVLPIVIALGAMAIAMVVVTMVLHLDIKAEMKRLLPADTLTDEVLPVE